MAGGGSGTGATAITNGDLTSGTGIYNCDSNNNCERLVGYLIKSDKTAYYKSLKEGDATAVTPDSSINTATTDYCKDKLGLIFTCGDRKCICLDNELHAVLPADNYDYYYVFGSGKVGGTDNPFESVANRILKITKDYIVIDELFKGIKI